ncbi:thiolase domain-containing protein [Alcaligenaceae bacterium]|nr:thiolase domain-containing protein [Alcaligenaceae bacterium]
MSIKRKAFVVGAFEHPTRYAPDKSTAQLHAECALGALADAGLSIKDVDGFFGARDAPGENASWLVDYLNLNLKHIDATDTGGCSYLIHVAHAAQAIAAGKCQVALITLAGRPRSQGMATGTAPRAVELDRPDGPWEAPYRNVIVTQYGMMAARHMHQYGTTPEQLAWVRVAASTHAQYNEHAMYRDVVTVDDVINSPVISDPLRRLDCCVISDGGGALVLTNESIARSLNVPVIPVLGCGETIYTQKGGWPDYVTTGAVVSGPIAFAEAGVSHQDIKYASVYDNFTIMVLAQLEDLGFCAKGEGGRFVQDGNLISGAGTLPWNTDGGGLCNNHPQNRGGVTKVIEAVRQLRGTAHPKVQVPGCDIALACGPGNVIGSGHGHATVILGRE